MTESGESGNSVGGSTARGREAVRAALIESASQLISEIGPRAMSVRGIAANAGVNHGQVHHYFGSKGALVQQAIDHMAESHRVVTNADGTPAPLRVADDERYWRTVVRLALDGEHELLAALVRNDRNLSTRSRKAWAASVGADPDGVTAKAMVATGAALSIGFVSLEWLCYFLADVGPEQEAEVRQRIADLRGRVSEWATEVAE